MPVEPLAYYNENDKFAAQWLRNLIASSQIAPGHVDERDIRDVKPYDLIPYTQCHFFAGIGGWSCALRLAGIPDHRPLWTGSCPCQPFSAAGKRLGFADDRHLWPYWRYLIQQRRPAEILGEQVASASQWLGLVRGDLEDLGYAVGAIPVEAASAGADHLRDRFWFVAHDAASAERGRGIQRPGESNGAVALRASDKFTGSGNYIDMAHNNNNNNNTGSQGWTFPAERPDQRPLGQNGLADSDFAERWFGNQQSSGQFEKQQQHSEACDSGDVANCDEHRTDSGRGNFSEVFGFPKAQRKSEQRTALFGGTGDGSASEQGGDFEWVLGADGKARRVKPGIRLLVDGFPNRVGLLRGFGNAIDPRAAKAFTKAALSSI